MEFALVLPGLTAERAEALVTQRLGRPPQLEIGGDDRKVTIVLDMLVAQASADSPSLDDLYDRLHSRLPGRDDRPAPDSAGPSTMQGLLPMDDSMPYSQRPTLPMSLRSNP